MRLAPAAKAKGVKPKTKKVKSMKTPAAKVNASQSTLIKIEPAGPPWHERAVTPPYQPNCMRCDGVGLGEPVCLACGALAPMAPQFWRGEFGELLFKEGVFLAPLSKYLLERMWEERLEWHEERMRMDHEDLQYEAASESESGGERIMRPKFSLP